jgi:hypothetical protein
MFRAAVSESLKTSDNTRARTRFDFQAAVVEAGSVPGFGNSDERLDNLPELPYVPDAERDETGEADRWSMRSPNPNQHEDGQLLVEREGDTWRNRSIWLRTRQPGQPSNKGRSRDCQVICFDHRPGLS